MIEFDRLFHDFDNDSYKDFCKLNEAIDKVMPLRKTHRSDLQYAIKDLSALLTTDRGERSKPYWTTPRLTSAYLRYFLPWNIMRIGQLINNINFKFASQKPEEKITILDLGSGPLTFPLALWFTHKELRKRPITIIASDTNPHILDLGKSLILKMCEITGQENKWEIILLRGNLKSTLAKITDKLDLITAANVLNELEMPRYHKEAPNKFDDEFSEDFDDEFDDDDESDDDAYYAEKEEKNDIQKLVAQVHSKLKAEAQALFIEPGTRLGGKWIELMRKTCLESDLQIILPCTHSEACPLDTRANKMWCHAKRGVNKIPNWLAINSKNAGLEKNTLSLSCLFVQKTDEKIIAENQSLNDKQAFIISDPFPISTKEQDPRKATLGRYACSKQGLLLLTGAERLPGGARPYVEISQQKDQKSGALLAKLANKD